MVSGSINTIPTHPNNSKQLSLHLRTSMLSWDVLFAACFSSDNLDINHCCKARVLSLPAIPTQIWKMQSLYMWSVALSNAQQKHYWRPWLWTYVELSFLHSVSNTPVPCSWTLPHKLGISVALPPALTHWSWEINFTGLSYLAKSRSLSSPIPISSSALGIL